ncbi:hypothetical protein [Paraburkholderia aromaticivorans]|uniref:hypothetical protein n=1 Tax=Paraburkholderia aromaticivorans TaxID=2026199 RepID=UPI001455E690|nr:hypothetical protein [Paraburkholderia aromaticivorans]
MSHAIYALAEARAALVAAVENAESANFAHSKLPVRKSEAEAASAAALTDFRANRITEEVAGIRKASADADAKDLRALIDQGAAHLARLHQDVNSAQARAIHAESEAKREEHQLLAIELDKQIQALEAAFLAAVAERYRVFRALNANRGGQSTFTFFKPSQALDQLIKQNVPPSAK